MNTGEVMATCLSSPFWLPGRQSFLAQVSSTVMGSVYALPTSPRLSGPTSEWPRIGFDKDTE